MRAIGEIVEELKRAGLELWADEGQVRYRGDTAILGTDTFREVRSRKAEVLDYLSAQVVRKQPEPEPAFQQTPSQFTSLTAAQQVWRTLGHERGELDDRFTLEIPLAGATQLDVVQSVMEQVVQQNDILRTLFTDEGQAVQDALSPQVLLAADVSASMDRQAALAAVNAELDAEGALDLTTGPLVAARLVRLSEKEQRLLVRMSRLTLDNPSQYLVLSGIAARYWAATHGNTPRARGGKRARFLDYAA